MIYNERSKVYGALAYIHDSLYDEPEMLMGCKNGGKNTHGIWCLCNEASFLYLYIAYEI